jgi:hypothetical protein
MTDAPGPPRNMTGYVYISADEVKEPRRPDPLPNKRKRKATNFFILQERAGTEIAKKKKKTGKGKTKKKRSRESSAGSKQVPKRRKKKAADASSSSSGGAVVDHEVDPEKIAKMKDAVATVDFNGQVLRTANSLVDFLYRVIKFHDRGVPLTECSIVHGVFRYRCRCCSHRFHT